MTPSDFGLVLQGVLVTAAAYWLAVAFYVAVPALFPAHAAMHKLQARGSRLSTRQHLAMISLTMFNQVPLTVIAVWGVLAGYCALGGVVELGFPTWWVVALHFIGWLIIFDVLFYAAHRMLHVRWCYRRIHALHHRFKAPVAYSGACVHPAEFLLAYIVPNLVAAVVLGLSYTEVVLFFSLEYVHNVHDHSGFAFPWDPFLWVCGQNSLQHDEHHRCGKVNYSGAFTMLMDWCFGTIQHEGGRNSASSSVSEQRL